MNRLRPSALVTFTTTFAMTILLTIPAWAQTAVPKIGTCPSGYHSSGGYCVPNSDKALPAIPKNGSCASGYHSSGDYCLANSNKSREAIIKNGSCPSGYHSSGGYCLKN